MINYYEKLEEQKKQEISQIIQTFLEQTFILERTYDKKIKRLQFNKQYQVLEEYLSFVRWYFSIMGIGVEENRQLGIIYLNSDKVVGEKMSRLTTLYGLALKLLYDEQMSVASTTTNIIVKLSDINERLHTFGLLKTKPSVTEMKKAISFFKQYQVIMPLDAVDDLDGSTRFLIYPTIHLIFQPEKVKELLQAWNQKEQAEDEIEGDSEEERKEDTQDTVVNVQEEDYAEESI